MKKYEIGIVLWEHLSDDEIVITCEDFILGTDNKNEADKLYSRLVTRVKKFKQEIHDDVKDEGI